MKEIDGKGEKEEAKKQFLSFSLIKRLKSISFLIY